MLTDQCAVEWPGVIDDSSGNFLWMIIMVALFLPVCVLPTLLYVLLCVVKVSCTAPDCSCDFTNCCPRRSYKAEMQAAQVTYVAPPPVTAPVSNPLMVSPPAEAKPDGSESVGDSASKSLPDVTPPVDPFTPAVDPAPAVQEPPPVVVSGEPMVFVPLPANPDAPAAEPAGSSSGSEVSAEPSQEADIPTY